MDNDTLAESYERNGIKVEIHYDTDAVDPRKDFDHAATMVCEHRRYRLGDDDGRNEAKRAVYRSRDYRPSWDEGYDAKYDFDDPPQLWAAIQRCTDIISMPLYLYDHGGITMSTSPFSCRWDSGQIGFIFMTNDQALKEWGTKGLPPQQRMSPRVRDAAERCMKAEVEEYDSYIRGDVYRYVVDPYGPNEDGCSGYYGIDACKEAANEYADTLEVVNADQEADGSSSVSEDQEAPEAGPAQDRLL